MKTSRSKLYVCLAAIVLTALASPGVLSSQNASNSSTAGSATTHWSVEVKRVQPGDVDLAYSFQAAIYESLLKELDKIHCFNAVYREGDRKAGEAENLLVLRTTVLKYTPGSETRRAVTTVSGATKLTVQSQLVTRDGKVLLDRKIDGNVRFFGTNLRVTHNLARNLAKIIGQSKWSASEPDSAAHDQQMPSSQGGL